MIPPKADSDFVAALEETLKIYTRSHDPPRPLVCLDEASKQLTRETRKPLLHRPRREGRNDYHYPIFSSWILISIDYGRCFHAISTRLKSVVQPMRLTK